MVDELRAAAQSGDPQRAVMFVLGRWAGLKVYIPRCLAPDPAADLAKRLIFAGVTRQDAQRILVERRRISARHARRLVARAVDMRGQSMSGSGSTLPAP